MHNIRIFLIYSGFILFIHLVYGSDVYVNINLDFITNKLQNLTIYKGPNNVTGCPNIESTNNSVVLILDNKLKTINCSDGYPVVRIFTYHSNIRPAIITIKNNNETMERVRAKLLNISTDIVVLNVQKDYINFVKIQNSKYKTVIQQEEIKGTSLELYSACTQPQAPSPTCITDLIFHPIFYDYTNEYGNIGSLVTVNGSSMEPNYENWYCFNGGVKQLDPETKKYKCICPEHFSSFQTSPLCEVLQQQLNVRQPLYCLPNTQRLFFEFSLFSTGYTKPMIIFNIKDNEDSFLNYKIMNRDHIFKAFDITKIMTYPFDMDNKWIDIAVSIEKGNFSVTINEKTLNDLIIHQNYKYINLDTMPLILRDEESITENQICIKNLKVNNRVVDLYTPKLSGCGSEGCNKCKPNKTCLYIPFKAPGHEICVCKAGYVENPEGLCEKNKASNGQLSTGVFKKIDPPKETSILQFKFRTLMPKGYIITLVMEPNVVYININEGLLVVTIEKQGIDKNQTASLKYYKVSDGEWHIVKLDIQKYLLRMFLDEYIPFNLVTLYYEDSFKNVSNLISSITFDSSKNSSSNTSYLICFETITLISDKFSTTEKPFVVTLNDVMAEGCDGGPNCTTLNCIDNKKCIEKWQNSSCVCEDGFVDSGNTCIFAECVNNPCKNNGQCTYNSAKKSYKCVCPVGFTGGHCEFPVVASASFKWWIILIIILLILLLIILVICVYHFCCKRKKTNEYPSYINHTYENTVSYNVQAGEEDYKGPPINFAILKNGSLPKPIKSNVTVIPNDIKQDLDNRKEFYDLNNDDLNLDQPLEYAFEGYPEDLDNKNSNRLSVFSV